jgi:SAM-dependent methyltransferase
VRRVLATDIYGAGDFEGREAQATMLDDPAALAPYPFREDHLEARWMDARRLDLPDAAFDAVFSLSSIEHFGGPGDIARAAREMARVVRPGGHVVVVTECLFAPRLLDVPLVQFAIRLATLGRRCATATPRRRTIDGFTPAELERDIVTPSRLELVQPLDLALSPETLENIQRMGPDGLPHGPAGALPHLVLEAGGARWTSAFLALRRPR